MGDDQGTQRVVRSNTPGIADDVGVTGVEAEHLLHREARVHTRQHSQFSRRRRVQGAAVERARIVFIRAKNVIGNGHALVSYSFGLFLHPVSIMPARGLPTLLDGAGKETLLSNG